jgi:VCBS repeat-containing protein
MDTDGDGVRDAGEPGVPGAQITLSGTNLEGTQITCVLLTTDTGEYVFEDLPSGTYQISQRQPTALSDGGDATSIPGATTGNDLVSGIVLSGAQSFTSNTFGESTILPQYVNIVWFFSSSLSATGLFRETIARAEELAGNTELAAAIREGGTPPDENAPPVAQNDSFMVDEDQTLTVTAAMGVLANDTDADEDPLTAQLVTATTNGTLTLSADGSFTYVPDEDFSGTDSFSYIASDGEDDSPAAEVTIDVAAVEDPPMIVLPAEFTDPDDVAMRLVGQPIDFTVLVEDPDDSDYIFQLDLEHSGIPAGAAVPTIDPATGQFQWTPTAPGVFEIRVIVVNGQFEANQETFLIEIVTG